VLRNPMSVLIGVLALLVMAAPPALGQAAFNMNIGDFDGSVPRASLDKYARVLGMDKDQKDMALTLHEGYLAAHKAVVSEMQAAMKEISDKAREDMDFSAFRDELPKKMKVYAERMQEQQKSFLEDVKALLNDEQRARWPRVERMRRRETGLRFSFISGAGVDVLEVADAAMGDAPPTDEIKAVLDRYELEVDKALLAMEDMGRQMQDKSMEAARNMDMNAIKDMMKKVEDASRSIRDVNRQYARVLEPMLPKEQGAKFAAEFKRRSFPRVYKIAYAAKCLDAAQGFSDLTGDQRQTLATIRESYTRELASANEAWANAVEQQEGAEGGVFGRMMDSAMGGGGGTPNPVSDARKARRALDDDTLDKVKRVLTDAQRERLPKKEDDKQSGDDMGVFFGGG
jgi:hypothetical protein